MVLPCSAGSCEFIIMTRNAREVFWFRAGGGEMGAGALAFVVFRVTDVYMLAHLYFVSRLLLRGEFVKIGAERWIIFEAQCRALKIT